MLSLLLPMGNKQRCSCKGQEQEIKKAASMISISTSIIFFVVIGFFAGGLIGWIISALFQKQRSAKQIADMQSVFSNKLTESDGKLKYAGALVDELRQQNLKQEKDISQLRIELDRERQMRIEALTKLEAAQKSFEEQKALIETMKTEMTDTFNALSSAALKSSSEDFLRLASQHLGKVVADTKGRLGEHQAALDGMIKPLHETLKRYEEQIRSIEENRHKAYGSLEEQLRVIGHNP